MTKIGRPRTELDTPALWVDLPALDANIQRLAGDCQSAGVGWRPHVKGIKVPAIVHRAMAAGAIGVTCAKVGEAEVMVAAGIRDLLIANQAVGPQKVARLVHLRRRADVKVAVDNPANVDRLDRAALDAGVELGVVVEIDVGMHRAGVAPGQPSLDLARRVHQTGGLRFQGLMAWEGHARRVQDLAQRRAVIEEAIGLLAYSADLCRRDGLPVSIVSAGGTGTYHVTASLPGVTEIQAGGGIFGDVSSRHWGVGTQPALYVQTTVTSRPAPDRVIVDAGFKTLPRWHSAPEAVDLPGVRSFDTSAEHGMLILEAPNRDLRVGDRLDFLVGYGDETVLLHDRLYAVRDEFVEVVWPVAAQGQSR
jgi:D-serine deaminase-like pyridoxal phosphate-dependent protein